MTQATLKLCIDLVPATCWNQNLRTRMKRSQWDRLRKKVYADQGNICCICGTAGRLNCHEAWSYDDERHIQKLMGFHAVCSMCHHVKHFGHAWILAAEGKLDLQAVIEYFMRVNRVGRETFEVHEEEAFALHGKRSRHHWRTDLGEFAPLVEQMTAGTGKRAVGAP